MDSYGTAGARQRRTSARRRPAPSASSTPRDPSAAVGSIAVGLHPTAMYSPSGKGALFVANTNDDTVSVIDTKKDKVVQTIETKPWPSSDVGYAPDQHRDDRRRPPAGHARPRERRRRLPVPRRPAGAGELHRPAADRLLPGDRGDRRRPDRRHQHPRHRRARPEPLVQQGSGHHGRGGSRHAQHHRLADPLHASERQGHRQVYTDTVFAQNGWGKNDVQQAKGKKAAPVPVPTRIGDPSTIKHVFLLVKENRTYDQVYGDMAEGNGDPTPGAVRREGHAEPARAGQAVRPLRQRLRRRHELRRGPQLADAGRQPRVHRVLRG